MNRRNQKLMQWFRSTLSGLMAFAILIQFSFISLNTMTCLVSGDQVVSVGEATDCCKVAISDGLTVQAKCCKYDHAEKSFFSVYRTEYDYSSIWAVALVNNPIEWAVFDYTSQTRNLQEFANPPPKLSGRDLLIHIEKFTI